MSSSVRVEYCDVGFYFLFFSIGLSKFLSSLGCFHLTRHPLGGARRGRPNQVLLLLLLLLLLFFISFCCRCCRCCCGSSSIRSAKEKRGERTKKSWLNYSGGDRAREPVDRRTHTAVTWTTMTRLGQTNQNADRKRRKKTKSANQRSWSRPIKQPVAGTIHAGVALFSIDLY